MTSYKDGLRSKGRPATKTMPKPIPDTPKNIARAILTTPPKREGQWKYQSKSWMIIRLEGLEGASSAPLELVHGRSRALAITHSAGLAASEQAFNIGEF